MNLPLGRVVARGCGGSSRCVVAFLGACLLVACGAEVALEDRDSDMLRTPLQAADYARLTNHEELVDFVQRLGAYSPQVQAGSLGRSVEGREIPYLKISRDVFAADRDARSIVLIFAEQHGTEPSGREAVLELALALANGEHDEWLAHMDLLLVPQVNPDGGSRHERRNAADIDLNRAHLVLDAPEAIALRELFHRWEPEVAVDVHEYYPWTDSWLERGWLRRWDVQFGLPTNLNVDPAIRALAEEEFLPGAIAAMDARGYTAHNYIVGTPEGVRYSTTDINDGRQSLAILQTLALIHEGRREQTPAGRIDHRTSAQRTGLEYLLAFTAEHGERIRTTVREARRRVIDGETDRFHLLMGRAAGEGPLEIQVDRVVEREGDWEITEDVTATIEAYRPRVTSELAIMLPEAYLVPAGQQAIIELMRQHRVEMLTLRGGEPFSVERLSIEGFTQRELEEPMMIADVVSTIDEHVASEGDVLIPTAQLRGLMVATALEPASMHGLMHYRQFAGLAQAGAYPVLRVLPATPAPNDASGAAALQPREATAIVLHADGQQQQGGWGGDTRDNRD